ncbi:hypothetical protein Pint_14480 [Pistacia integerrima]|uniref:Uncharacterized protein n=1 Tax=Pistacia integerrima TaxID=434235 RepID=A0ACC0Y6V0_9ROSI|nr:hypothetical protein Pint_14480 [Pistacia integerrima]
MDFECKGGAIKFLGTKRHHDNWLKDTENYVVKGCFAMTELGHGSNVKGIETFTTYDSNTGEFVINAPCESAQKYCIGGAANHATQTVFFLQLEINGKNQGVHAFICQIRDADGKICPNTRIADCGHKIGLNRVDNSRIWKEFDNVRIPKENLLNSIADVSPNGEYLSAIKDPDQICSFHGRFNIWSCKYSISSTVHIKGNPEKLNELLEINILLLLDWLINSYKMLYVNRTPQSNKTIYVISSAFKATSTWHNQRTLQECREACGGQGLKTENHVGHLKSEFDLQSTFEGDNNVVMQQVNVYGLLSYKL